ncbi:MAG: hypothetical protein AAFP22_23075, partial [Planctomycetota bacterium]
RSVGRDTLRHYFTDRDGAVRAALELAAKVGAPGLEPVPEIEAETAAEAIREALEYLAVAWRDYGLGRVHRVGIEVGLADAETGKTYLDFALEPVLGQFATLIGRLQAEGKLEAHREPRAVAFATVSPVLLMLVHQHALGGKATHPVGLGTVIEEVVASISAPRTPPSRPDRP